MSGPAPDHELVIGCDVSTKRIALARTDGWTDSILLDKNPGTQRFGNSHRQLEIFARQAVGHDPILAVLIEQPAGKVHPSLWGMFAIAQSALYLALERLYAYPVPVFTSVPTEWKKAVFGNGHADKQFIWEWCRFRGEPGNQDEADALAIAWAGREMITAKPHAA